MSVSMVELEDSPAKIERVGKFRTTARTKAGRRAGNRRMMRPSTLARLFLPMAVPQAALACGARPVPGRGRCSRCYSDVVSHGESPVQTPEKERRRRPRGVVREGLVAAGLELARTGGPDAVVLREATRIVGVVPNAAYRHFADRDQLLTEVCAAAMRELADRMAAAIARVRGKYGNPVAARRRLRAVGTAYLGFAREEPGLFATAFAVPQRHAYGVANGGTSGERMPLDHLRAVLDELVDAGALDPRRREGIEFPIWSQVHGLAVLLGPGPLRDAPEAVRRRIEERTRVFVEDALA